jgi:hypothetical protein
MSDPSPYAQPRAAWRVTLDGADLTATLAPRLISLRLTEKSGEEADALEIVVQDTDAQFLPPRQGATLSLALGWSRGTGVPLGLVNKGTFTVDELTWSGPPDRVTITAHSANFKGSFRTRKTRSWHATAGPDRGADRRRQRPHARLPPRSVRADRPLGRAAQQERHAVHPRSGPPVRRLGHRQGRNPALRPARRHHQHQQQALPTRTITRQQCSTASWRRAAREKARRRPGPMARPAGRPPQDRLDRRHQPPPPQARLPQRTRRPRRRPAETTRLARASATMEITPYGDPAATPAPA